jgi:hypothetical protein
MTDTQSPDTDDEVFGPIDFLVLEFQNERMTGGVAAAMLDLVERGIVRIYDVLAVRKEEDGSIVGLDISDLSADSIGGMVVFAGARSGLVGDEDVNEAAEIMEPGTTAVLIVYENAWARPFVAAAREAGAEVIASARIPADVIMEVLEELEAADAAN